MAALQMPERCRSKCYGNCVLLLQRELAAHKCTAERIEVWQRGVDTVRFNPNYRCDAMRARLSNGNPEAPLLVHVGRLGAGMPLPPPACVSHTTMQTMRPESKKRRRVCHEATLE